MSLFPELIQVALGAKAYLSLSPTADEWGELYSLAKKQSLVGVCFAGVQKLQKQRQSPPEMLYLKWMGMAAKIQQRNEVLNRQSREIFERIKADGYDACVLKGQAMASLYGDSLKSLRQPGDIDIWMMDSPKQCIEWARGNGKMYFYDYHHADLSVFQDTEVELHYRPSISRNLIRNRRLQKWFAEKGKMHTVYDKALGFCKPDFTFNVALCQNHSFWHLMYEGVGMRQMMDLYFVLKSRNNAIVDANDNIQTETLKLLKHFKLERFASACMWVMKEVFHLEDKYLLCKPDEARGKALLDEKMQAGNFGHHDERLNSNRYKTSRIGLMWAWMKHNLRLFWQYPEDVLWTPIGILRISLWRRWRYRNEFELKKL